MTASQPPWVYSDRPVVMGRVERRLRMIRYGLARRLRGERCPICREHTRCLAVHIDVNHAEPIEPWYLRGSDE